MRKTVPLKVKFGKNLKEYRIKAGHTQESLAEKTGMSATAISSIETGNSFPTYNNLISHIEAIKLSSALKIISFSMSNRSFIFIFKIDANLTIFSGPGNRTPHSILRTEPGEISANSAKCSCDILRCFLNDFNL